MKDTKNIAIINSVINRSTGKISYGLYKYLKENGRNVTLCYGYGQKLQDEDVYRIESNVERYIHALLTRITGYQGCFSNMATTRLIRYLKKKSIDTIYGVALHGYYLNEKRLFDYIIENNIQFIYVMTEEYPYRGKCGYANQCTNYLTGCGNCPYVHEYPRSWIFDRSRQIYNIKKNAYKKIKENAVFVGPEFTIKEAVKSPLLEGISTKVIDEAVATDFYYPRDTADIKRELSIDEEKIVLLCVAPSFQGKKGTKYFTELARRFEEDDRYVFVHVGYRDSPDGLPKNYIPIDFVWDQERLAQLYSIGDLFIFPSLLDTMPNACLEALSCGVPLLCFNISGMPYIGDKSVLTLVAPKDVSAMEEVVKKTTKCTEETRRICRSYALKRYSNKDYYARLEQLIDE